MLDMTLLSGRNFIGIHASCEGSGRIRAMNPQTGEYLDPEFALSTPDERSAATHLAAQAFPTYRDLPTEKRAAFLERIAEEIDALGEPLLERASLESALPMPRLIGERARTTNQLRMFAALIREGSWVDARIDTAIPDRSPLPKPDIRRMLVPIGPVVVFGASNFPMAFSVAGGDTASAFAAGCPVIVKAHPAHPGTSEMVARAVLAAAKASGMPEGVFSMIHADEAGSRALVTLPEVQAVGFTGSQRAGRALFDAACARPRPIPVFAEMGSVNPIFFLPGALKERAETIADGYVVSLTTGVGQFCTNPGISVAVRGTESDAFLATVEAKLAEVPQGMMLTEGICDAYHRGTERLFGHQKLRLRAKGQGSLSDIGTATSAVFTVAASDFLADPGLAEEVFGPCGIVVIAKDLGELMEVAKNLEGQLTSSIHAGAGDDIKHELMAILREKAGRLVIGGYPTGVEVCPSLQHGGPYPATTDCRFTSVGTAAILRFARPVCYQNCPEEMLPPELLDANPVGIWRTVNGTLTKDVV